MTSVQTSQLPTGPEPKPCATRARDALQAVGSRVELGEPGAHGVHASTPITGDVLFTVAETTPEQADAAIAEAAQAFTTWRTTPAPVRGALVARLGELLVEHKDDAGRAGHHRGREDHLRGPRRGAGDDRHLRVRRRAVAPAVRQDHRLRASGPPADGDVASARRRRRHHRIQLPGRGVVVERRDRAGVRRHRGVEAVGAHAADRAGLPGAGRAGRRRCRGAASM